jgi:uncharacterized protein
MLMQRIAIATVLTLSAIAIAPNTQPTTATPEIAQSSVEATRQKNEQTIKTYFDLLSQKRMDEWLQLWAENGVQDMPYSPQGFPKRVAGKAAITKH